MSNGGDHHLIRNYLSSFLFEKEIDVYGVWNQSQKVVILGLNLKPQID